MSFASCQYESKIIAAVRADDWSPHLKQHAASCAACRETAQLAQAMAGLAEQSDALMPPVADPNVLWLKAQLHAPQPEPAGAKWVAVAIAAVVLGLTILVVRLLNALHSGSVGIPSPMRSVPFPVDGTFVVLIVAVVLVLYLPSTAKFRLSRKSPDKLITL